MRYLIPLILAANLAIAQDNITPQQAQRAAFTAAIMSGENAVEASQAAWGYQRSIQQSEPTQTQPLYVPVVNHPLTETIEETNGEER